MAMASLHFIYMQQVASTVQAIELTPLTSFESIGTCIVHAHGRRDVCVFSKMLFRVETQLKSKLLSNAGLVLSCDIVWLLVAGEMLVGPAKVLFMDEISTGLDSSTCFQIIKCLRDFSHLRNATVLINLLQPPPEVYNLFDDILLLSEGMCTRSSARHAV